MFRNKGSNSLIWHSLVCWILWLGKFETSSECVIRNIKLNEAVFQKHATQSVQTHCKNSTVSFDMFCFCSESGSCDLQARLSCSWSHETKHALHELSAGRVSGQILHGFYHLMSFQLCFNCLTCLSVCFSITDTFEAFILSLLSSLMISGPNSPFYKALIEPEIGSDFSSSVGYVVLTRL